MQLLAKNMAAKHVHAICTRICIRNQTETLPALFSPRQSSVCIYSMRTLRSFSTRRNFPRVVQLFFVCELSGRTNRKTKKYCAARGKFRLVENSLYTHSWAHQGVKAFKFEHAAPALDFKG